MMIQGGYQSTQPGVKITIDGVVFENVSLGSAQGPAYKWITVDKNNSLNYGVSEYNFNIKYQDSFKIEIKSNGYTNIGYYVGYAVD